MATAFAVAIPPLVKPEWRISRIRLSGFQNGNLCPLSAGIGPATPFEAFEGQLLAKWWRRWWRA